jgi:hypothetical protein
MKNFEMFTLINLMEKKAEQATNNFHISAAAFSKKNNLLGTASCNPNKKFPESKKGTGIHAEAELIKKYKRQINKIYICRIGRGGIPRPIEPCPNCAKLAKKYGIKIINIHDKFDMVPDYC